MRLVFGLGYFWDEIVFLARVTFGLRLVFGLGYFRVEIGFWFGLLLS